MAIRPVDIRRKEFKSSFRGYDANEVDDFLDAVADEFERVFSENQRLVEEATVLKGRLEQFEQLEESIQSALVHAEQAAQDLRQNASREAELIVREAKERSHRILADSSGRVERVQESYEVLRKAKQEFANDFRRLLKGYLAVMDNIDVASAKEIEASLRERLDLESIAAAREAAEARKLERDEPARRTVSARGETESGDAAQRTGAAAPTGEDGGARGRTEAAAAPAGETTGEHGPEPEAEEPEVDPSSAESPADQGSASEEAAAKAGTPGVSEEVDREEPMPAGEGRAYDEFFDRGEARTEEAPEERKLFRASRFLRRRG
jgi:cell division initiation protein